MLTRHFNRPWVRLAGAWFLALALTAIGFATAEYRRLGRTDADGVSRVSARVVRQFGRSQERLADAAHQVASQGPLIARAPVDPESARSLFVFLKALPDTSGTLALTVYSPAGAPLAWSGVPSDLPSTRVMGARSMFVAPGALGPRLFAVEPVLGPAGEGSGTPTRLGSVVAEIPLPAAGDAPGPAASVTWRTGGVDVRLRARYQGAGAIPAEGAFTLNAPDGSTLLEGQIAQEDVRSARDAGRGRALAVLLLITAAAVALLAAPLLSLRRRTARPIVFAASTAAMVATVVLARLIAWFVLPRLAVETAGFGPHGVLFRSPVDFLLTAAASLVLVAMGASTAMSILAGLRQHRIAPDGSRPAAVAFVAVNLAAGAAAATIGAGMVGIMRSFAAWSPTALLSFSLVLTEPARIILQLGLVVSAAAALWLATTVFLAALIPFRIAAGLRWRLIAGIAWAVPLVAWAVGAYGRPGASTPWYWSAAAAAPLSCGAAVALAWPVLTRQFRHASQAARLLLLFAALAIPAVAWYPSLFVVSDNSRRQSVETRFAPLALRQRDDLQAKVRHAMADIDAIPGLADLVQAQPDVTPIPIPTETAFHIWSRTDLSTERLTSALEVYGEHRLLASRFALKLPDYTSAQQYFEGSGCDWEMYEEVSPFFSEERRLLYAGRGICVPTPTGQKVVGAIAIYAMLDYGDLPFIAAQSPYSAAVRAQGPDAASSDTAQRHDLDFAVYGWSRTPVYASGTPWILDDRAFRRVYASRAPFWATLAAADQEYAVHLSNDRGGVYALGYRLLTPVEHLVHVAELTVLAGLTFVCLLTLWWFTTFVGSARGLSGRDLLREIRASFYRKLFLAFVAAATVPVIALAFVAQAYLSARLLAGVEESAARTASVARRVVEDYAQIQERGERRVDTIDDDILVWIARAIDQDVNVFDGPSLTATSERSLYASGELPTRTSADIYRAIVLDRRAAYVGRDRVRGVSYLSASAPVKLGGREAILTVPLTLRQQATAQEIDDLNRRIVLAVLVFILVGSALGLWMAERIADPVNRLQRATARIARGDLTVRVALTSTDELRRLVDSFNTMATELQRQQGELAHVYRLEAWADMARQVAHDIKNPLTPIQLSAEHLRRVHTDRGAPLSPVLEGCVESILTQVRLLRQLASEFSSFASSPTARPVEAAVDELLAEVADAYRPGLAGRVSLDVKAAPDLPHVWIDRTLIGRALTNILDNAIHAMPNGGAITITAATSGPGVAVDVTDTGVGMDAASVARLFEPYFSTKATGTGLGLTIARRNVELNGGTIAVRSVPQQGTTVTLTLPAMPPAA
jgi:signal transduction histidine kinase